MSLRAPNLREMNVRIVYVFQSVVVAAGKNI